MNLRDPAMRQAIHQAAAPEHIEQARELCLEYAGWLKIDLCFQDFERELAQLPGDYAPPGGRLLLAYRRTANPEEVGPVGCVALRRFDPTTGEIKRLYVRPQARAEGTGRRLVAQVILAAREIGYRRLVLDTLPQMTAARALYASFGFREIPGYYANPLPGVIYLALDLPPVA